MSIRAAFCRYAAGMEHANRPHGIGIVFAYSAHSTRIGNANGEWLGCIPRNGGMAKGNETAAALGYDAAMEYAA